MIQWSTKPSFQFGDVFGKDRPLVFYTGEFGLPGTGAASEQALQISKTLDVGGFRAVILPFVDHGRPEEHLSGGVFQCQGVFYLPAGNPSTEGRSRLQSWRTYSGTRSPVLDLLRHSDLRGVLAVITHDGTSGYSMRLRTLCRQRRIGAIAHVVEWHEGRVLSTRIAYLDKDIRRRLVYPRFGGVIAITSFLEKRYRTRGCEDVLRFPPVLETDAPRWRFPLHPQRSRAGQLKLVFSGTPDRDRQDLILEAVAQVKAEGLDIRLDYVGSSREKIARQLGSHNHLIEKLQDAVVFHGWVSSEQLRSIIASADFGILFREDSCWSRACFPSKVPEFLALGVPILCNLTSDLGNYLKDGIDALIVDGISVAALAQTLRRAIDLQPEQRYKMASQARYRAEQSFDIRRRSDALGQFVRNVAERACR